MSERLPAWRHVVQTAMGMGIPVPAFSASLAYYDSYRSERLPANLTQAQRDFFGAHTYERIDRAGRLPYGLGVELAVASDYDRVKVGCALRRRAGIGDGLALVHAECR